MCCSNIRHKTCYKAFQSLDLYLGYCVKKNCTITNAQLNGENGRPTITAEEMKKLLDPNQDPKNLSKSYFKLTITNDLITSKLRLSELYSTLAYRKSIQTKNINMLLANIQQEHATQFVFELQPCGRQPQHRYIDQTRKIILLKIFKTLDLISQYVLQQADENKQHNQRENPFSPENTIQSLWDQMLEQQE